MNERDWQLLITVHEQGSITRASRVLHLTQPALSSRLRMIEEFFGVQAFIRGKKGVQFTAEGEYLIQRARLALAELDDTRATLDAMRHATTGTLRVSASHLVSRYVLPGLLRRFQTRHPAVEYRVRTGWTRDMVLHVLANEAHLAIIREDCTWTGIKRLLFAEHMLIVAAAPFSPDELPHLPQIHYTNEPAHEMLIDNWWAERFTSPPKVGMVVDRADTCLEMVKQGFGYGFLPSRILPGLEKLCVQDMHYHSGALLERGTWLICKEETANLRPVQAFLTMLDEGGILPAPDLPQRARASSLPGGAPSH